MSRVSVRARLRQLPPERRLDVLEALREGRAAQDPGDAPLVVALAERPARFGRRWPFRVWIQPHGVRDRVEGVIHLVLLVSTLAWLGYQFWSRGGWRHWAVSIWVVLIATSIPAYVRTFRVLRSAPAALAANRDVST